MNAELIDTGRFQFNEAIQVATNAGSTPDELTSIVNKSFELNRLIAAHPNAIAAILSKVIEYRDPEHDCHDDQTQRIAIRHPNISIDDALLFANRFPEDLFMNPSIDLIIAEDPDLFEANYDLLQARGCPLEVLQRVADNGTRAEQVSIARNPSLPLDLKNRLTVDYFYQRDLDALQQIASRQEDEVLRECVKMYANTSRQFCLPRFLPFDWSDPSHRLADQIFCGFPFTSDEYPWPIEQLGNHMQPIAQIDLAKASSLLDVNLGTGLIQVWGGIESGTKVEVLTRLIPESALTQELDWFYPQRTPWLDQNYDFDGCVQSCINQSDYPAFSVASCRIDWLLAGRMFYPSLYSRVFAPRVDDRLEHGFYDRKDDYHFELDGLEDELDTARISRHRSFNEAWAAKPLVFLGGYSEALSNAWNRYPGNMLFYHSIDYGVMMTVGVTYQADPLGKINFSANWTCDN